MSQAVAGGYDGEGPNVAGGAGNPAAIAISSDVWNSGPNPTPSGQGKVAMGRVDRRRRLVVTDDGPSDGVAINVSAADQVLATYARWLYVSVTGNINLRLRDASADVVLNNMPVGLYKMNIAVVRKTNTTLSGVLLY